MKDFKYLILDMRKNEFEKKAYTAKIWISKLVTDLPMVKQQKRASQELLRRPLLFRDEVYFALLLVEDFVSLNATVSISYLFYAVTNAVPADFLAKSVVVFNTLDFF